MSNFTTNPYIENPWTANPWTTNPWGVDAPVVLENITDSTFDNISDRTGDVITAQERP